MSGVVAGTDPYPWPYDGRLEPRATALVVCGAQRRLVAASQLAQEVAGRVGAAAATLRRLGGTVIWLRHGRRAATGHAPHHTRHHAPSWLPEPGSADWSLTGTPEPCDLIIDAPGWDGCFGSDLERTLRAEGFGHLVLAGYASEVTVDSTVRTLNDRGFECLVLSDGCAPLDADLGARALRSLTMSGGIFGAHGRTADLLAALERRVPAAPAGLAERTVA